MDYVSEDDIKNEILTSFSKVVDRMSEKDMTRVITNGLYGSVRKVIDDCITEKEADLNLEEKIKEIANEITSFNVFVDEDRYSRRKSVAQELLDEAVVKNKDLLEIKVKETFDEAYKKYEASQDIAQIMADYVYELFSVKKED